MNRITELFDKRKGNILSIYFTAGFPKIDDTEKIAIALANVGADIIEIGIPFSDPVADGPTIQASNKVALDNGMNIKVLLKQVSDIRKKIQTPIILMGYLNPVLQYGVVKFAEAASKAGVDGLIIPDMPIDEYISDFKATFDKVGLSNTFLISPTTSEERIRKIDSASNGFIYAVSSSSTTGAKSGFTKEQEAYFDRLKSMQLKNHFLIGFGISNYETFSIASQYGAGAIVGSAFINLIQESQNLETDIEAFISSLRKK